MKHLITAALLSATVMTNAENPFYQEFSTPHQTPPFSQITVSDYMPAIDRALSRARGEINAIATNRSHPDFDNTIEALQHTGEDLDRVLGVYYPLLSADASDEMLEISMEVSQKMAEFSTEYILNEPLWQRVKQVYENRENFNLTPEQNRLLDKTYEGFADAGANLRGADREKYKELSKKLASLTTAFGQNVLKEMSTYQIWLTSDDLAGLPESSVTAAAEAAKEKGREGEYLFTLDAPVYMAFMKNSSRRDLREKMWRMYMGRNTSGEYNNLEIIREIAETRRQLANLLGADTYARNSLKHTMAKTPESVYFLLNNLRDAYTEPMRAEIAELSDFAAKLEGQPFELKPWDYSYYSNKLRAEKYAFDEEAMRPYFELNKVIDGVFGLATKLYGLQFTPNTEVDVYHPDVKAFDVTDANGAFLGVLYTDFFPRATKRPGAWMTNFSEQYVDLDGKDHRPVVSIVMNFTKPTADTPSLLTPYEVETFLHEFGHALHGLMARSRYQSLSGTNVYRDFVELPSQFNENYLTEKEFLDGFARHYQTGEPIPQQMIDALVRSSQFGAAYACMRQLMFGFLDMAWHTTTSPVGDPVEFENQAVKCVEIFAPETGAMVSPQFSHIFSGGYAAGYYSYKWAEVLDADAFDFFKQNGIFDKTTADKFRHEVLERGGTDDPAVLYRNFRGKDASIDALLRRDGIKK